MTASHRFTTQQNEGTNHTRVRSTEGDADILELVLSDDELLLNWMDSEGRTPLYWYVQGVLEKEIYHERTVELLLEQPDINSAWVSGEGRHILTLLASSVQSRLALDFLLPDMLRPGRADTVDWDGKDCDYLLEIAVEAGNKAFIDSYFRHRITQAELHIGTGSWVSLLSRALFPFTRQTRPGDLMHECATNRSPEMMNERSEIFNEPTANEIQVALCGIHILAVGVDGPETFKILNNRTNFDLNRTDHNNRTLLWHSADKSYITTTRKLLELGVELHTRDTEGDTPLKRCSKDILDRSSNKEVFDLMVNHMAQRKSRYEIMVWGLETDHENLCRYLIKMEPQLLKERSQDNATTLIHAARHGRETVVNDILLSRPSCVSDTDIDGRTALHWAAIEKHASVAKLLIKLDKSTWIHVCNGGDVRAMATLLAAGISVDVEGQDGHTRLHLSALSGNIDMAEFLLKKGANINAKDQLGMTPIVLAGLRKQRHAIQLLLHHGASIDRISRMEWLEYFDRTGDPTLTLEISETSKSKHIDFIQAPRRGRFVKPNTDKASRRLRSYADYEPFHTATKDDYPGDKAHLLKIDQPVVFGDKQDSWVYNLVQVCFPHSVTVDSNSSFKFGFVVKSMAVHWKLSTDTTQRGAVDDWETTHYATTLEFGHIPEDPFELLTHLCKRNEEKWIEFCDAADEYTADMRMEQIREQGTSTHFINQLAHYAQLWAKLRKLVKTQQSLNPQRLVPSRTHYPDTFFSPASKEFGDSWCRIANRITQLDQATRDLMQLEFAWVSIREAHLSTSLATSMKRLSWITFVFLPITFTASVFGMNVNLFKDNPEWWWFVIVSGVVLSLTILGWLCFKYGQYSVSWIHILKPKLAGELSASLDVPRGERMQRIHLAVEKRALEDIRV
ncbi:hypothetical protein PG984_003593 [Apiospora sp. TS-2023a]